jgi:hypothetical protein
MKSVIILLIVAALGATFSARQSGDSEVTADVIILKFRWNSYVSRPDWDKDVHKTLNEAANNDRQAREQQRRQTPRPDEVMKLPEVKSDEPTPGTKGFQYRVTVKNNGKKTIRAVGWDYLFVVVKEDAKEPQEESRHSFASHQKIKPGESKELLHFSTTPPTRVINAEATGGEKPLPFLERVVINRIEYSDGSVWNRP